MLLFPPYVDVLKVYNLGAKFDVTCYIEPLEVIDFSDLSDLDFKLDSFFMFI